MTSIVHKSIMKKSVKTHIGEFAKRGFDIIVSALALLILSSVFALVALLIKRTSPGPVLFHGRRVGRKGKVFQILKLRTMEESPESYGGACLTAESDSRITPMGRWLRDTKLNELPQLWNVLIGEMSLVGPRPEDPQVVSTWPKKARQVILSLRPGITSPASIFFRNEEQLLQSSSIMEKYLSSIVPSKLRLDEIYVRDHNFLGDLDTLFLTAIALLPNMRKWPFPENLLLWGPLSRFISRHLSWFLVDVPVAFVAVGISGALWRTAGPFDIGWGPALLLAVRIGLLFGVSNAVLGLNRIAWSRARPLDALGLAFSNMIVTGIMIALNWIWPGIRHFPIGMWVMTSFLAFFGFLVTRYRLRLLTGLATRWLQWRGTSARIGERVLIVGAGEMAQFANWLLRQNGAGKVFNTIGLVDDDPKKIGQRIEGCKVLGTTQDIARLVGKWDIGVILFSINKVQPKRRRILLDRCRQTGARLVLVPDLFEMLSACLFVPQDKNDSDIVSPDWNGRVPAHIVVRWLMELEALSKPNNPALLSRLRQVRTALAVHIASDHK